MKPTLPLIALGLLVLAVPPVRGVTITLDFTSSLRTALPGQTVTFSAVINNIGPDTAFLNGDSFSFPLPVDDTPFFLNVPPLLGPGQIVTTALLNVNLAPGTPVGLKLGVFDLLGGSTANEFKVLASQSFAVQVVPEPSTLSGVWAGVLACLGMIRFRRRFT